MNSVLEQNRSRWGYHSGSYDLYLKLKQLKKWYWETHYAFHRWAKWTSKTVNRKGAEPKFCPEFVCDSWSVDCVEKHGKFLEDFNINKLFDQVRRPSPTPVDPLKQSTIDWINALYFSCRDYFEK